MLYKDYVLLIIFCLFSVLSSFAAASDKNKKLADFLSKYTEVKSGRHVQKAQAIFKKLRNFAALPRNTDAELLVVKTLEPLAEATVDGVVLSNTTLDLLYRNVNEARGDTRLAFMLGHEIAHLEQRDVQRGWGFSIENEKTADEKGFVYAAMADYPVQHLLFSQPDFFAYWQQQTGHALSGGHPLPVARLAALKAHLADLLNKFNFFKFGIALAHFNHCDDAKLFLKAFQRIYEAPEVLNSLAYCELQQAAQMLDNTHYCAPFLLDAMNQTPFFNNVDEPIRGYAEKNLNKAVRYLDAVVASKRSYFPAYLNLAAAYLYLGEVNEARRQIERAIEFARAQQSPLLAELQAFQAVIIYEAGVSSAARINTWNNAMANIEKWANPSASACILYNAATLLELRKRNEATKYWQWLAKKNQALPQYLKEVVCDKVACAVVKAKKATRQWSLPFQWNVFLYKKDNGLQGWESYGFKLENKTRGKIYQPIAQNQLLLTLEGYAELFIDKRPQFTLRQLKRYCTVPLQEKALVAGKLLSCQSWAALVQEGRVKEVWVVKE